MSTPASPSAADSPPASPIPDRASSPELPLTMTASTLLLGLPRDATAALAGAAAAGDLAGEAKVVVRWKPVGSAPAVRHARSRISAAQRFEAVVLYLRRQLRARDSDSVFLYVNSAFAPALDEVVGNLHRVSYAKEPEAGRRWWWC